MIAMPLKKWLTVAEAAEIIGCSQQRVRFLAKQSEIKSEMLTGKCWLIDRVAAETMAKTPAKTGRPRKSQKNT
jgi:excisionase family DNA binding protein